MARRLAREVRSERRVAIRKLTLGNESDYTGDMIATVRESKARLSELVERAASGEEVLITVNERPKARLVAAQPKVGRANEKLGARTAGAAAQASGTEFRRHAFGAGEIGRGTVVMDVYWDTSCVLKLGMAVG